MTELRQTYIDDVFTEATTAEVAVHQARSVLDGVFTAVTLNER